MGVPSRLPRSKFWSFGRRGIDSSVVVSSWASCINSNPIICKIAKIPPSSKNKLGTLFKTSGSSKYLSPSDWVELAAATLFGLTKVVSSGIQIAAPNPYAPIARLDINPKKKYAKFISCLGYTRMTTVVEYHLLVCKIRLFFSDIINGNGLIFIN